MLGNKIYTLRTEPWKMLRIVTESFYTRRNKIQKKKKCATLMRTRSKCGLFNELKRVDEATLTIRPSNFSLSNGKIGEPLAVFCIGLPNYWAKYF